MWLLRDVWDFSQTAPFMNFKACPRSGGILQSSPGIGKLRTTSSSVWSTERLLGHQISMKLKIGATTRVASLTGPSPLLQHKCNFLTSQGGTKIWQEALELTVWSRGARRESDMLTSHPFYRNWSAVTRFSNFRQPIALPESLVKVQTILFSWKFDGDLVAACQHGHVQDA